MYIKNKIWIIYLLFFLILGIQSVSGQTNDKILNCLNGTWVDDQQYLKSKTMHLYKYGWGDGKRITETTLEIDLVLNALQIPGGGKWNVEKSNVINNETIQLWIRSLGGVHAEKVIIFHFISNDKFWIEPPAPHEFVSVGRDNLWYRLSGPRSN